MDIKQQVIEGLHDEAYAEFIVEHSLIHNRKELTHAMEDSYLIDAFIASGRFTPETHLVDDLLW